MTYLAGQVGWWRGVLSVFVGQKRVSLLLAQPGSPLLLDRLPDRPPALSWLGREDQAG